MSLRATTTRAKAERREGILSVAADAFDRLGYAATSMDWLAGRAGIAKGTLYLYFPTKESVFLALYRRELDTWFARLNVGLEALPANDTGRLAGLAADALEQAPRLPPLAAILHTVLERNTTESDALAFKRHLLETLAATGGLLEGKLDFLAAGDGERLLLRALLLMAGCWQAASPAPVVRRVLMREEFAPLRIDYSEEFENLLVLLLEGWRHAGGGF